MSPEANFLAGKFIWTNWDVDELKGRAEEIAGKTLLDLATRVFVLRVGFMWTQTYLGSYLLRRMNPRFPV
jgi:hypothetical protein